MAYRSLYRTYRPARFGEVIGQKHITDTLKNQVATDHTAHAYLFCGTRGTGKTTTARIFARAVNCLSPENGEPCGHCEACRAMQGGYNPDIIEIDAASNNGVDNVRDLIEQVQYATLQLKTRVLIIDEVHMLSSSAFNALLKTLEEPPEHTLFILATTEPQKLLPTIISRCQRYDFHRLSTADITGCLKDVLQKAGASVEEEGLRLIARCADGSMRDALSLTDQCLAFRGDTLSSADVYDVLGSMDSAFLDNISSHILAGEAAEAVRMIDDIVTAGRDLSVFCRDLSQHMRALLLAKTCGRCEDLLDCAPDRMDQYIALAQKTSESRLLLAMEILLKAQGDMRYLTYPRNALECAVIKLCRPEDTLSLTALEARVAKLEREGVPFAQTAPAPAPAPAQQPAAQPVPAPAPTPQSAPQPASTPAPAPNPAPANSLPCVKGGAEQPLGGGIVAPAPAATGAEWTADTLFTAFLTELRKQNILLYSLVNFGRADKLASDTLSVAFPETATAQYQSINAAINRDKLNALLSSLRPNTVFSFIKGRAPQATDEQIDRAKELFGDSLTVIG